jgi:hypothetical protein
MKIKTLGKSLVCGLMISFLSASIGLATGDPETRPARSAARITSRQQATPKTTSFSSEKTDSWLCAHVSPFFCSSLFPTLSSNSGSTSLKVPDRSRHN